jgi:hypothetical protein
MVSLELVVCLSGILVASTLYVHAKTLNLACLHSYVYVGYTHHDRHGTSLFVGACLTAPNAFVLWTKPTQHPSSSRALVEAAAPKCISECVQECSNNSVRV